MALSPIFISARFRSGSTFLWNLFRNTHKCVAFYEPCHEGLPERCAHDYKAASNHFGVKSYWDEYKPVLSELKKYHNRNFACQNLLLEKGDDHKKLRDYISFLLQSTANKTPVLQFNRVDFRLPWLRSQFPEARLVHLYRDPREQWMSMTNDLPRPEWNNPFQNTTYDLIVWSTSLARQLPFLFGNEIKTAYHRHYILWKLSSLMGTRCSDYSVSFDSFMQSPAKHIDTLMEFAGFSDVDTTQLNNLVRPPKREQWRGAIKEEWFLTAEKECDDCLKRLDLMEHFGLLSLKEIKKMHPLLWKQYNVPFDVPSNLLLEQYMEQRTTSFLASIGLQSTKEGYENLGRQTQEIFIKYNQASTSLQLAEAQNSNISIQLKNIQTERDNLTNSLHTIQAERDNLTNNLHAIQTERDNLTNSLHAIQAERDNLTNSLHAIQAERDNLIDTLNATILERDNLNFILRGVKTERDSLASRLHTTQHARDNLAVNLLDARLDRENLFFQVQNERYAQEYIAGQLHDAELKRNDMKKQLERLPIRFTARLLELWNNKQLPPPSSSFTETTAKDTCRLNLIQNQFPATMFIKGLGPIEKGPGWNFRWGFGPKTTLQFRLTHKQQLAINLKFHSNFKNQHLSIEHNGSPLGVITPDIGLTETKYSFQGDRENTITITYSKWNHAPVLFPDDARLLSVMYECLTIEGQEEIHFFRPTVDFSAIGDPIQNDTLIRDEYKIGKTVLSALPTVVTLALTTRCNYKTPCLICDRNTRPTACDSDINQDIINASLPLIKTARYLLLHCGGEAMFSPFFDRIITHISPPTRVSFATNAMLLTKKRADLMLEKDIMAGITVSLDAATPEIYKIMRPSSDFDKVIRNISYYTKRAKSLGRNQSEICLNMTLCQTNFEDAPKLVDLAKKVGAGSISFNPMNPENFHTLVTSDGREWNYENEARFPDPEKRDAVLFKTWEQAEKKSIRLTCHGRLFIGSNAEKFEDISRSANVIPFSNSYEEPWKSEVHTPYGTCRFLCIKPWQEICIEPNGEVRSCYYHDLDSWGIGNVMQENIFSIWNSDRMVTTRKNFLKNGVAPQCKQIAACQHCSHVRKEKED